MISNGVNGSASLTFYVEVCHGPDSDGRVDQAVASAPPTQGSVDPVNLAALAEICVGEDLVLLHADSTDDGTPVPVPVGVVAKSPQLLQDRLKAQSEY